MPDPGKTVAFDKKAALLAAELPLTAPTGKIRVKRRSHFAEYGNPVATRSEPMSQSDYIEWQIGYDLLATAENVGKTFLSSHVFVNTKEERKHPYELSELLFFAHDLGFVSEDELQSVFRKIAALSPNDLFDVRPDMRILRTHPVEETLNGLPFSKMEVRYPLVVHRFGAYEIYAEVINREKQKGVGVQPMLYVCIPLANVESGRPLFGRVADKGETCRWVFGKTEGRLALELFQVFGMLSARHRHDTLEILKTMFPFVEKAK